jgi:hypothetical protein
LQCHRSRINELTLSPATTQHEGKLHNGTRKAEGQ